MRPNNRSVIHRPNDHELCRISRAIIRFIFGGRRRKREVQSEPRNVEVATAVEASADRVGCFNLPRAMPVMISVRMSVMVMLVVMLRRPMAVGAITFSVRVTGSRRDTAR